MDTETAFQQDCANLSRLLAQEPGLAKDILNLADAQVRTGKGPGGVHDFFISLDVLVDPGSKRLLKASLVTGDKRLLEAVKNEGSRHAHELLKTLALHYGARAQRTFRPAETLKFFNPVLQRDADHDYLIRLEFCNERGRPFATLVDLPSALLLVRKFLEPLRGFFTKELAEDNAPSENIAACLDILQKLQHKIAVERDEESGR